MRRSVILFAMAGLSALIMATTSTAAPPPTSPDVTPSLTKIDFGILAWFAGVAVGVVVVRVAGGPVGVGIRVLAGLFAATLHAHGRFVDNPPPNCSRLSLW